jgi:hypothetical protein
MIYDFIVIYSKNRPSQSEVNRIAQLHGGRAISVGATTIRVDFVDPNAGMFDKEGLTQAIKFAKDLVQRGIVRGRINNIEEDDIIRIDMRETRNIDYLVVRGIPENEYVRLVAQNINPNTLFVPYIFMELHLKSMVPLTPLFTRKALCMITLIHSETL